MGQMPRWLRAKQAPVGPSATSSVLSRRVSLLFVVPSRHLGPENSTAHSSEFPLHGLPGVLYHLQAREEHSWLCTGGVKNSQQLSLAEVQKGRGVYPNRERIPEKMKAMEITC